MTYQVHNYETGDILQAQSLNEMDAQIAANETAISGKQDPLTFDNVPTSGSNNPVKSSGIYAHTSNTSNPHSVTAAQVGLGNCNNTADLDKPISTATQTALDGKASTSDIPTELSELTGDSTHRTVTDAQITTWNNKQDVITFGTTAGTVCEGNDSRLSDARAAIKHASTHMYGSSDIAWISAAQVVTGVLDIGRIPAGAKERLVTVANDAARFALTIDDVQTGDSVYVTATERMYIVIDDTKLSTEAGYMQYRAYVSWDSIDNKPSSFTPSVHASSHGYGSTDAITISESQVTNLTADLAGKVDAVSGKGLSTNDYTTAEKTKLAGISAGAEVNVQSDWTQSDTTSDDYIKNKPSIPTALSELSEDTTHRTVTDTEKSTWNGKQNAAVSVSGTLFSSDWSSNTQTISVSGVAASNTVIVSPSPESFSDYGSAKIYCSAQGAGTLTFTCDTVPTSDITVVVVIL